MKNIETILSEVEGIELTDEQKKSIVDGVNENYKTVNDWQKQVDKVNNLTQQLSTTKDELKKFDGVDADGMKKQIADLEKKLKDADDELQTKLADRDFNDLVKDAIQKANGKNAKAITALLDLDTLKKSKNQEADVADAIKKLSEAEDSSMLFGESVVKAVLIRLDPCRSLQAVYLPLNRLSTTRILTFDQQQTKQILKGR